MSEEGSGEISYDAIAKLVEFKKVIASAISDVGIATSEDADADTMASNIKNFASSLNAVSISYDNTNSELTSTNVQDAVDELDTKVDSEVASINSNLIEKFNIIEGTTSSTENEYLYVDYPEGFNANNCVVISVMFGNNSYYTGGSLILMESSNSKQTFQIPNVSVGLLNDNIGIRAGRYATDRNFKICLMRIDI